MATPSPNLTAPPFRQFLMEAVRYWEPRRLLYNLVLLAVAASWLLATWPHFRGALTPVHLLQLCVLALLANLCYCAAYLIDIPMLQSSLNTIWRRRRWILWTAGMLFAILLASYWIADEIYPDFSTFYSPPRLLLPG